MTRFRWVPTRRAVLVGLTANSLPVLPALAGVEQSQWTLSSSRLKSRRLAYTLVDAGMRSRHSAARVGRYYLRMIPEEENINALLALVQKELSDTKNLMQDRDLEDIHGAISKCIANDFARERVCCVKGWILSRTEARIAGLAAML